MSKKATKSAKTNTPGFSVIESTKASKPSDNELVIDGLPKPIKVWSRAIEHPYGDVYGPDSKQSGKVKKVTQFSTTEDFTELIDWRIKSRMLKQFTPGEAVNGKPPTVLLRWFDAETHTIDSDGNEMTVSFDSGHNFTDQQMAIFQDETTSQKLLDLLYQSKHLSDSIDKVTSSAVYKLNRNKDKADSFASKATEFLTGSITGLLNKANKIKSDNKQAVMLNL